MKENLITNEENQNKNTNKKAIANEEQLFKEVKKMLFIKYLTLFFWIFRLFIMFYSLSLIGYLTFFAEPNFYVILLIYSVIILPVYTILNLIIVITGIVGKNFMIQNQSDTFIDFFSCCCCWCKGLCTRNVTNLKILSLIFGSICLFRSFYLLHFFLIYVKTENNIKYFPNIIKNLSIKWILYFIDTILLLCQGYFFYYYEYFLNRGKIYIEFYKRLIIKNRKKEADLVRNELPTNMDNFLINSETELENV